MIVGIIFAVLIPFCIITVIVIAIIVFCTGACACCIAARNSVRSNRKAAEVNLNIMSGTEASAAPPPSYSQSAAVVTQQQSSATYSAYSAPQAAPQFTQPRPYTSPDVKLAAPGMELKYPAAIEAADVHVTMAT